MSTSPTTSTWAAGDYPAMARLLVPAAERAVAAAGTGSGTTVLDVGCGTGNAALAAALTGADVTAVDPTPELLAIAARRARASNLPIAFRDTDADRLTGTYDRVLTVFGAMYAPDAARAAAALTRCVAPGGLLVSAAWTPNGFMAAAQRATGPYLPAPPSGARPPTRWGDEGFLRGLFPGHRITVTTEHVTFTFPSPRAAADFWVRTAGHVQVEAGRLRAAGTWQALHDDLAAVFTAWNRNPPPGPAPVRVEASYLLAVIRPTDPAPRGGRDHD
ncbi:class I SAM-dependent methyltransferase [Streptomyces sp. Isolate_45]|uniref:class I SAM-dependent methyltransferase n=1 Tax=Streptomyces sp. Isolate_45 TaxID=2950111 RepID=UPI002481B271|nr:class I SAM-dependent methyltransferase [Streptomyces sp. Isolate_45]MDA5282525.1 class I SAM-dependent methyltransferase [Streptomyces sp. Isolate_45]